MRHQGTTRRAALITAASALALVTTQVSAQRNRKLRFSSAFTEQDLRAEAYKNFAAAIKDGRVPSSSRSSATTSICAISRPPTSPSRYQHGRC